ncbi:cysteine-type peptidase [Musa troglodytarum]|uniref:Cysteine-type peptidase n=1 Tax=Musa troglodytarum TaxID=320322 RepID=A0A9E7G6L3_9LILI|nr:cysteine-type peptidase [Musa troglodytarum]
MCFFFPGYGKRYGSAAEIRRRFGIFLRNLELIRSTNRRSLPCTLGINRFADWTWEEFQAGRLGAAQNSSATYRGNNRLTDEIVPETIIARTRANNTTGALEAAYAQVTGKNISLSEQQLVDCAYAFNNFGCNGGLPSQAFEYIKYNGGIDTEESYPYSAMNGVRSFKPEDVGVKVVGSVNITKGAEDELRHAVGLVHPDVNHAVLAVGYGVEDGIPYWLIKNSWGSDWGLDGYFKMELGKNMCSEYLTYLVQA